MNSIAERVAEVQKKILAIPPGNGPVRILAVTKKQNLENVEAVVKAGVSLLGVNYLQEGEELMKFIPSAEWHFIGHIQSRKAKLLTGFSCVQSLDRLEVAKILSQTAQSAGKKIPVLVEVNIGEEEQKSGIALSELETFLKSVSEMPGLIPKGLMCMPPPLLPEQRRPFFKKTAAAYRDFGTRYPFDTLSMGTSEDYLVAIEEGSNMARLGTVLFGVRPR